MGTARYGGDSSVVQGQLKSVRQIQGGNVEAFAAILADGSVVTWGDHLSNMLQVESATAAGTGNFSRGFAAILGDGSVVTWGDVSSDGDSSALQDQLKPVHQIQGSPDKSFAT